MNRHWPSVGVIIPNHNRVDELCQAVASVEAQQYEGTIRIYIVYLERPGIADTLLTLGNVRTLPSCDEDGRNSIAVKRNIAIDTSTEDLIALLDDDDVWHPLKLKMQVEAFTASKRSLAVGTRLLDFSEQPRWNVLSGDEGYHDCSRYQVATGRRVGTSSLLIDGPTARTLRFDERPEWLGVEDLDFKLRLSRLSEIRELEGKYTGYRIEQASISVAESTLLRAVNVLAASAERNTPRLSERLAAIRLLLISTFGGYGPISESHGCIDQAREDFLECTLDGRLFGRIDPLVFRVVRMGWRKGWRARPVRTTTRVFVAITSRLARLINVKQRFPS